MKLFMINLLFLHTNCVRPQKYKQKMFCENIFGSFLRKLPNNIKIEILKYND